MQKIILFIGSFLLFGKLINAQEEITIYHSTPGQSVVYLKKKEVNISSWKDSAVFIKEKGEQVEIVLINPDPLHYTYNIKIDEFEIKDDLPDFADLLGALNAIPALTPTSGSPNPFLKATVGASAYASYYNTLDKRGKDIDEAKEAIKAADNPETKQQAFDFSVDAGYRHAQKIIRELPATHGRFNSKKLLEELNADAKSAIADPALYTGMAATDAAKLKELLEKSLPLLNQQIVQAINEVKKSITVDPVQRFIIRVTDKNQKVKLIIKKKEGDDPKTRMEMEKLLCVVIPEYDRKALELIPMASLTFASDVPEYGVKEGIITEREGDGLKFRVGAMLLYNIGSFGKYKEGAWGIGLGYALPQKNVLATFSGNLMVSFKNTLRLGFGVGYSSYPSHLKNDLLPGDNLPEDIKDIEELVEYRKKLSFFINFSISGITILKK